MKQPSAQTTIQILSALKEQTSPAVLAYWVTPNTVLTLSGARAYCDGVFYHNNKKILSAWSEEMKDSIKVLETITNVYFAEAKVDKSVSKESYAGYDMILTPGLEFVFKNTRLLGSDKAKLVQQKSKDGRLIEAMCFTAETRRAI